jgi:hypothetical protein
MENTQICPEDELRVLLPASKIPNGATITKRTGEVVYILRQGLKVYSDTKGERPLDIEGVFLINTRGEINQVKPDTLLHWHVTAETLVDELQSSWMEEDGQ